MTSCCFSVDTFETFEKSRAINNWCFRRDTKLNKRMYIGDFLKTNLKDTMQQFMIFKIPDQNVHSKMVMPQTVRWPPGPIQGFQGRCKV